VFLLYKVESISDRNEFKLVLLAKSKQQFGVCLGPSLSRLLYGLFVLLLTELYYLDSLVKLGKGVCLIFLLLFCPM